MNVAVLAVVVTRACKVVRLELAQSREIEATGGTDIVPIGGALVLVKFVRVVEPDVASVARVDYFKHTARAGCRRRMEVDYVEGLAGCGVCSGV